MLFRSITLWTVGLLAVALGATLFWVESQLRPEPLGERVKGLLAGDTNVRSVRDQLVNSVFPGDGTSLADLGIQTDRYGKLVFDDAAFTKAYTADPASVQSRLTAAGSGFVSSSRSCW